MTTFINPNLKNFGLVASDDGVEIEVTNGPIYMRFDRETGTDVTYTNINDMSVAWVTAFRVAKEFAATL